MAFINSTENLVQVWVVYEHVIYIVSANWGFYAAANCVDSILQVQQTALCRRIHADYLCLSG